MESSSKRILISTLVIITLLVMIEILLDPIDAQQNGIDDKVNNRIQNSSENFNDVINLSNDIGHSELPRLGASGSNVYTVWVDDTSGNRDVLFRRSPNYGCNFEETINVNNQSGGSVSPQIAVTGHYVYIVWEQSPVNNGAVFFSRSTDNGSSFEKIRNVGNNTGFNGFPQVAVSGNNVYLVWHDATHGILFAKSKNNGNNFDSVQTIGNNTGFNGLPQISASGNNVYLVWTNNDNNNTQIYFTKSTDNGSTFKTPIILTEDKDSNRHRMIFNPRIIADPRSHTVHIIWHSGRMAHQTDFNYDVLVTDVLYKRSTDNGSTFEKVMNLSNKTGWSTDPQIAVSQDNNVYVVWTNNAQEKYGKIYFTRSTDNGSTFEKVMNLSNKTGWSTDPQIAVSQDNNVYVVWTNNATGNEETTLRTAIKTNNCALSNPLNNMTNSITNHNKIEKQLNVAFVDPTFTIAAYDKSFYLFYSMYDKKSDEHSNITDDIGLLSSIIPLKYDDKVESHDIRNHLKWLLPESNIVRLSDQDVHNGAIFNKGTNKYDTLVLGHQEYVTQQEYDNLKQFVANGGILLLLDGNVFYAEVKYDNSTNSISLVKGHYWEFNGKSAWRSVEEKWANETSEWMGSNFLCCWSLKIKFNNNPFGMKHDEEQHITNPKAKILLDYNATEDEPNPRKFTVATYELEYKKGKVIALGFYADHLKGERDRFWRFFDSLLYRYAISR
jgi:N,N-dimethylformamidase beta subunit-like protein